MTAAVAGLASYRVDSRASRSAAASSVSRLPQDRDVTFDVVRVPGPSSVTPAETSEDLGARLVGLLGASGNGDEQAFATLYDLTSARVYGLVLRIVRDAAQAAEVTQEIYVEVWKQSARYDSGRGAVLTWMMTIAHGRAVDRVRSSQAR